MDILANVVIDLSALIIIILIFLSLKRVSRHDFGMSVLNSMLIVTAGFLVTDILSWRLDGLMIKGVPAILMGLNTLTYFFQVINSFLFLIYTDYWIYSDERRTRQKLKFYMIPLIIQTALLISNLLYKNIFFINELNEYERGKNFFPGMIVFWSSAVLALCISIKELYSSDEKEKRLGCLWMTGFIIIPFSVSIINLFFYGVSLTAPSYTISLLMIHLNIHQQRLNEEKVKVAKRDVQLQQANTAVMLSQIQPHFLYNSLNVIKELCRSDPELAQKVTVDFSKYLRCNLDSIRSQKPIPFTKELEHTKTFLDIEKLQYEDNIDVIYDINVDSFLMPTLTLQPIAENAVKYGLKKKEHVTVKISTYDDDDFYYITVEDDGMGFDPSAPPDPKRSHVGLTNVRKRLAVQSDSTLDIESTPGIGTKVKISLPKERKMT